MRVFLYDLYFPLGDSTVAVEVLQLLTLMWVCFLPLSWGGPDPLMDPFNLKTPIFWFRECVLISLMDKPMPTSLLALTSFWTSYLDTGLLSWSPQLSSLYCFPPFCFTFWEISSTLFSSPSIDYPFLSPQLCYWELASYPTALWFFECSLRKACCSFFSVAISSLISPTIVMNFAVFSFSV